MNGNGELTGCHWIREAGWFTGPITITNTCSLGIAHHATVRWLAEHFPEQVGETYWPLPVVGETFDGWLNDIAGLHVREEHVLAAIDNAAGGPVAEGNVGGGTGMIAYGFKGGTGTASRIVETKAGTYTLGALVQANHGVRPWLRVCGVQVGEAMQGASTWPGDRGSIIAIVATDAPLMPLQLQRIARRVAIGMGRGGTPSGNNSGDIYLAFSTANDPGQVPEPDVLNFSALSNDDMDGLFLATVESVDEAIVNAMLAAETMSGKAGRIVPAIDPEDLLKIVRRRAKI
jgi:L-aminopeptidase/D-esterase-like protein